MSVKSRRLGLWGALAFALSPLLLATAADKDAGKTELYKGKVVPLAKVLEKEGVRLDRDAAPLSLALVTEEGKVHALIKDDGSRPFFKDPQLLHRPMRVTGRLLTGSQLLQVRAFQSDIKGEPHEVYYWCETCAIRRGEKFEVCECCGGPMELREVPVKK